jgi:hypothetical protein
MESYSNIVVQVEGTVIQIFRNPRFLNIASDLARHWHLE